MNMINNNFQIARLGQIIYILLTAEGRERMTKKSIEAVKFSVYNSELPAYMYQTDEVQS